MHLGLCLGVLGGKDGAAVLIRQYRGLEGADLSCYLHYLLLVHADKRLQNRQVDDRLRGCHCLHGLACDLTEVFAGDYCLCAVCLGNAACDAHHESAHNEGKIILGALCPYLLLNVRERDDLDGHFAAVGRQYLSELDDLLLCLLGGVREREKVHGNEPHAALCDHIGRNGAVYTAGQQRYADTVRANRHAACTRGRRSVDIGGKVTDFDMDHELRLMHIDLALGVCLGELTADIL